MGHEEPRPRVLRDDLRQEEEVGRRLQQPPVRRPARVQEPEHALVVGQGRRLLRVAPPAGVRRQRPAELLAMEVQAVDRIVLGRAVDGGDVADVEPGRGAGGAARVVVLVREVGRRHRVGELPRRGKRNCGSSASRWCSAVVADRGRPTMITGPSTGRTASSCSAYQCSMRSRVVSRVAAAVSITARLASSGRSTTAAASICSRPTCQPSSPRSLRPVSAVARSTSDDAEITAVLYGKPAARDREDAWRPT